MLKMKWMTDHDGRLVATWAQSDEPGSTGGREGTIMIKMIWIMDHKDRLVASPAQYGELQSSQDHPGARVPRLVRPFLLTIMLVFVPTFASAQDASSTVPPDDESWNLHIQSTAGAQGHPSFPAEYTGLNSLTPGASVRDTVSVDVTGGVRLWRGGEFFADVLIWQGYGLSKTEGLAGFPNGEAYRVGKTYPDAYLCRAYIRETIGLGGNVNGNGDGSTWIEVENPGPTIPPASVARIFEPFFTTKAQGTGLGLAIARNIARAHGGDLILSANEPDRVCFTLIFPAAQQNSLRT